MKRLAFLFALIFAPGLVQAQEAYAVNATAGQVTRLTKAVTIQNRQTCAASGCFRVSGILHSGSGLHIRQRCRWSILHRCSGQSFQCPDLPEHTRRPRGIHHFRITDTGIPAAHEHRSYDRPAGLLRSLQGRHPRDQGCNLCDLWLTSSLRDLSIGALAYALGDAATLGKGAYPCRGLKRSSILLKRLNMAGSRRAQPRALARPSLIT